MRIAISGAQSTGKTTLINALRKIYPVTFKTEITRELAAKGFKINEAGTDETQNAIMNSHVERLNIDDDVIYDRCSLDGVVYTHYLYEQGNVNIKTLNNAINTFTRTIDKYDKVFYLKPEFKIEDDGQRSTDISFRDDIVTLFETYISDYNLNVVVLTGTVNDRVKQFENEIDDLINS